MDKWFPKNLFAQLMALTMSLLCTLRLLLYGMTNSVVLYSSYSPLLDSQIGTRIHMLRLARECYVRTTWGVSSSSELRRTDNWLQKSIYEACTSEMHHPPDVPRAAAAAAVQEFGTCRSPCLLEFLVLLYFCPSFTSLYVTLMYFPRLCLRCTREKSVSPE